MALIPHTGRRGQLDALKNISGYTVFLFTNAFVPNVNSTMGDVVLATYSGYAAMNPAFPNSATGGDGKSRTVSVGMVFAHNGGGVGNLVQGWGMRNLGGNLCAIELFPAPKAMSVLGDIITITLTQTYTQEP